MEGQTSAIAGQGLAGRTIAGQLTEEAGGLPQHSEKSATRGNPWRRRAVATTTWSPR